MGRELLAYAHALVRSSYFNGDYITHLEKFDPLSFGNLKQA